LPHLLAIFRTSVYFPPPPSQKTNPSSGWSFSAYSRVFTRIHANSCGLKGFKQSHKSAYIFSLFPITLSTPTRHASAKFTGIYFFDNKYQRITRGSITLRGYRLGRQTTDLGRENAGLNNPQYAYGVRLHENEEDRKHLRLYAAFTRQKAPLGRPANES